MLYAKNKLYSNENAWNNFVGFFLLIFYIRTKHIIVSIDGNSLKIFSICYHVVHRELM